MKGGLRSLASRRLIDTTELSERSRHTYMPAAITGNVTQRAVPPLPPLGSPASSRSHLGEGNHTDRTSGSRRNAVESASRA